MVEYICERCGKVCTANSESLKRKYCSHECANKTRWEKAEKKRKTIICAVCGRSFEVIPGDARVKNNSIKYCSKKCMGEANKTGKTIKCENCGKAFYSTRRRFCCIECARAFRIKNYEHKTYKENGYIVEFLNGYNKKGNIKQHRRIMEEYLGRRLEPDEIVHHINGDKTDNRIENLKVMKRGAHSALHRKAEKAAGRHLFGGHNNN